MQQHPVPQNVTSYQFRLIGDMTLTQFLELLAGGVVAYIFYSTNLIGFVKYFLMFISVILGVAFAFLPLEGRPLTQWTMAFIRAIYLPTQFYWEKRPKLPEYLSDIPTTKSPPITQLAPNTPTPEPFKKEEPLDKEFEEQHSKRIEELLNLYKELPTSPATKPTLKPSPPVTNSPVSPPVQTPRMQTVVIEPIAIVSSPSLTPSPPTHLSPNTTPTTPQPSPSNVVLQNPTITSQALGSLAVFNASLPFPSVPETPNTLVGMVFDKTGNIIENAVVEIKNQGGTVRATKTNRLGQFFLATPLNSDSYTIYTEKEKLVFKPISLKLEGKIYPPLEIRATN